MSFANDDMVRTIEPGFLAPADGNYSAGVAPASLPAGFAAAAANASGPRDAATTSPLTAKPAKPSLPPPRAISPTNGRKPPHSRANATTLCALLEAAASCAASAAPPSGSSSGPQPALLPPRPLIDTVSQFLGYNPRTSSFQSCAPGHAGKRSPAQSRRVTPS